MSFWLSFRMRGCVCVCARVCSLFHNVFARFHGNYVHKLNLIAKQYQIKLSAKNTFDRPSMLNS